MSTILFNDSSISTSDIRKHNIKLLEMYGFETGGLFCRSGELILVEKKTKWQLVYGVRCNVSGRKGANKYFSLSKDFDSKWAAMQEFKQIKPELCAKNGKYSPSMIY